jgi:tRNA(Leu) C34 or U34 (ribose-2'-O)-methylase TrmL
MENEMRAIKTRGFAAIGLTRPKCSHNVGGVMRAAQVYGASLVVLENDRSNVTDGQDTMKAYRSIPVLRLTDLFEGCPYDCVPVAVDLVDNAEMLPDFKHPQRAFYIFGPEDGTLGKKHLDKCVKRVMVPTKHCMNLAATVNVILYDRLAKQMASNCG